jgi:transposase-like protein
MEITKNIAKIKSENNIIPQNVVKAFSAIFLDENRCRQWVMNNLHPDGGGCPECGHKLTEKQKSLFSFGKRVCCKSCSKWFNERTGTLLSGSKMTYAQVFLLAFLLGMGQHNDCIAAAIGCDEETVRLWRLKFRILERQRKLVDR